MMVEIEVKEPEQAAPKKKAKVVHTLGQRKEAVASAITRAGTGIIRINGRPLELFQPEMARMKLMEPLVLAGESAKLVDIDLTIKGGGTMGQADAGRQAMALGMVGFDRKLKSIFLGYDRTLLVADFRRTEPHKPSRSSAGPRRHKQRSKR